MSSPRQPMVDPLRREESAWTEQRAAYDHIAADLIDQTAVAGTDREVLLDLITTSLQRPVLALVETAGRAALTLAAVLPQLTADQQRRACQQIMVAAERLGAVVERGPETVSRTADLPPGSQLPAGADPAQLTDPSAAEIAGRNAKVHQNEIERWRARQHALQVFEELTALVVDRPSVATIPSVLELRAGLLLVPALPPRERDRLAAASP